MQIGNITQLTTNKDVLYSNKFPLEHKFVKLYPECGDWEAWYMDGKLIAEGHTVRVEDILDAISNVFPNTYKSIGISDERAEEGFELELKNML